MRRLPALFSLSRRSRAGRGVILLAALAIAGYAISTFFELRHSYQRSLREAADSLTSTARSAEMWTSRSVSDVDAVLLGSQEMLDAMLPRVPLADPAVAALLRQMNKQSLLVRNLWIFDSAGHEVNGARAASSSAAAIVHSAVAAPAAPSTLTIGPVVRGNAGRGWSLMFSRPLRRGAAPAGTIAAEVPTTPLADFFQAASPTAMIHVALLSADGVVLAGAPNGETGIGSMPRFARAVVDAAARGSAGLIEVEARPGGDRRWLAYRKLRDWPLLVATSRSRAEILRPWYEECRAAFTAFLAFGLTAGGLAWLVVRALRRQQLAAARQRLGEGRLKRQRALLQNTLENMGEGLSVFSSSGRLVAWNSRFAALLELPDGLSTETRLRDVMLLQAERGDFGDVDPKEEAERRLDAFFRDVPTVKERITRSGRVLQIRRRAMPDGAVVTLYSDITELKASERSMALARSQAELANRAKSEFLANTSHELRTPLNAIIGFSEIIANQIFGPISNEKYLEYISDIHSSSLHLLSIINDILDMSKIEAGKFELSKEILDIPEVVGNAVRMLQARADSRDIDIFADLSQADAVIWADERAFKQIVLNLLSNAIKFSNPGGRVYIRATAGENGLVILEVEDFGIGMSEEEQARALQPFGQAKAATTRNYGGTGLGLPITKGLVEAHGGVLTLASRIGRGTLVRIVLPGGTARRNAGVGSLASPVPAAGD
jgi:signal transduction histidine kinase